MFIPGSWVVRGKAETKVQNKEAAYNTPLWEDREKASVFSHISFNQTQPAAAFKIFTIGSRESSSKLDSNRKDNENSVNVNDSIFLKPDETMCVPVSRSQNFSGLHGIKTWIWLWMGSSQGLNLQVCPHFQCTQRQPQRRKSLIERSPLAERHTPNILQQQQDWKGRERPNW